MHYAVLAQISLCYSPLQGRLLTRYSPVRHFPLLQLTEVSIQRFSFDLHVLSTPPAFILSQDQTLNEWYLNSLRCSNQFYWSLIHSFKEILNPRAFSSLAFCSTRKGTLPFLVLRLFTLFNLQGTRRFRGLLQFVHRLSSELIYFITHSSVCQVLFSNLFFQWLFSPVFTKGSLATVSGTHYNISNIT